jgi:hypothetical protein
MLERRSEMAAAFRCRWSQVGSLLGSLTDRRLQQCVGLGTQQCEGGSVMLAWFGDLNAKERRTMGACFGGWALDAFDVQMYSFVIPTLIALWGLSRGEAGLIGTVTLLISSLGGWFSGTLADRFGRVRMLQITILWYSVFTFLCAFAQNFEQLFVLRALHGFGFGGEWAAGASASFKPAGPSARAHRCWCTPRSMRFFRRRSPGARCSRSASCLRFSFSGSAGTSTSPRFSATRSARARRSALLIYFRPFAVRICGPRSRCR